MFKSHPHTGQLTELSIKQRQQIFSYRAELVPIVKSYKRFRPVPPTPPNSPADAEKLKSKF